MDDDDAIMLWEARALVLGIGHSCRHRPGIDPRSDPCGEEAADLARTRLVRAGVLQIADDR
jgi:hypothetical protein